jgi:hypothetical protein
MFCVDLRTAIISLHIIRWLVFVTETVCLLRGTSLIFVWIAGSVVLNAGLLPQRPGFCTWSVYMRFVVDRVALDKVFLRVRWFSSVSIIPSMLRTHLHLHGSLTKRTNERSLGPLQKAMPTRTWGIIG